MVNIVFKVDKKFIGNIFFYYNFLSDYRTSFPTYIPCQSSKDIFSSNILLISAKIFFIKFKVKHPYIMFVCGQIAPSVIIKTGGNLHIITTGLQRVRI